MSDDPYAGTFEETIDKPPPKGNGKSRARWTIPQMVYRDGADIPRREFLYGYAYARGFVTANIGDVGVGKSIELIAELLALASGKNLLGIIPRERVRVGYWNGDDPYVEVERRIHAVCQHYGIDLKTLIDEGWLYIGTRDQQPLCIASTGRLGTGPIIDQDTVNDIEAFIRENDIGLMAFDPLKSLHRVPENSNTDMDVIGDIFNVIAERTGAAIALTHHIRKPSFGQNEATVADARGATALINKVRLSRVFNVMTTQLAIAAQIKEEDRRRYFRVDSGKANIAPPEKATWFKIVAVACKNGEDTPTVVSWKYPNVFDQVSVEMVNRIRTIAAEGKYRKDSRSDKWIGRPVAEMLDLDLEDEADQAQVKKILKTWFANGVLKTTEGQDDNRNKRVFVVPGRWTDAEQAAMFATGDDDGRVRIEPVTLSERDALRQRGFNDDQLFDLSARPQYARDILADPNRNANTERYRVVGEVLPTVACIKCGEIGDVKLIKDTNQGGKPVALHPWCAPDWYENEDAPL
jgi:hypothetical protein